MARVKRGVTAHAKHKKVLNKAKGYYGRRKNTIRVAKQAVEKPCRWHRPQAKKRTFRSCGSSRINGPCATRSDIGIYRRPQQGGIDSDRKFLADLAVHDAAGFRRSAEQAAAAAEGEKAAA